MTKPIVVTGTSTGIGWGIADVLVRRGLEVFGTVRTRTDADRLKSEFGSTFTPLVVDVTNESSIKLAAEKVSGILGQSELGGLVNNAGIAVVGPLLHLPLAEFRRQLAVNLIAPLRHLNHEKSGTFNTLHTRRASYHRGAALHAARPAEVIAVSGTLRARHAGSVDSGLVWRLDRSGGRYAPLRGAVHAGGCLCHLWRNGGGVLDGSRSDRFLPRAQPR